MFEREWAAVEIGEFEIQIESEYEAREGSDSSRLSSSEHWRIRNEEDLVVRMENEYELRMPVRRLSASPSSVSSSVDLDVTRLPTVPILLKMMKFHSRGSMEHGRPLTVTIKRTLASSIAPPLELSITAL